MYWRDIRFRMIRTGASLEELDHYTLGSLRRAVFDGDVEEGSLMAGQVCGQLHEIRPVEDIFRSMAEEAEAVIRGLKA